MAAATTAGATSVAAGGRDAAVLAAARRLGAQRARRAQGGIRMYDDERRRSLLTKRLREAGFDERLDRVTEAATTTTRCGSSTRDYDDEDAIRASRHIRKVRRT